MNKKNLLLTSLLIGFAVLIGFFLRFWQLGSIPVALNPDEAALAYNAWSLLETGTDEWGQSWPVTLQSFGDYKLIGYPAFTVLSFYFFGLSDWSVRFFAALAGSLLPLAWWFLWRSITPSKNSLYTYFGIALLAMTPVFIWYSRMAFESMLSLFFFTILLGLIFSKTNQPSLIPVVKLLAVGLLTAVAALTYNTPVILIPLFIPLTILWHGPKNWKNWVPSVVVLLVVTASIALLVLPATKQKTGITLMTDETTWAQWTEYRQSLSSVARYTLGNWYVYLSGKMIIRFFDSFSPNFLVLSGGSHPWHQMPGWAHLLWAQYGLAVLGIFISLFEVIRNFKHIWQRILQPWSETVFQTKLILLGLTAFSLVPAIITVDAPHATRSLFFFVLLIGWSVIGAEALSTFLSKYLNKNSIKTASCAVLLLYSILHGIHLVNYLHSYQINYPQHSAELYKPGLGTAALEAQSKLLADFQDQDRYVAVIDPMGTLYVSLAWYTRTTPQQFHQTAVRQLPDAIGFRYGEKVSNFHFIAQEKDRDLKNHPVLIQWDPNTTKWILEQ